MLLPRPLASAKDITPQKSNTAFLKILKSLWAVAENGKPDFLVNQYFFVTFGKKKKKNLLTQSHLVKPFNLVLLDDLGHCVDALPPLSLK